MADLYPKQVKSDSSSAIKLSVSPPASNLTFGNPFSNTYNSDPSDRSVVTLRTPEPIFTNTRNRSRRIRKTRTLLMQLCACLLLLLYMGLAINYLSPSLSDESSMVTENSLESLVQPVKPPFTAAVLLPVASDTDKENEETTAERPVSSSAVFDTPAAPKKVAAIKTAGMATPAIEKASFPIEKEPVIITESRIQIAQQVPPKRHFAQFASLKPAKPVLTTTTTTTTTTNKKEVSIPAVLPKKNSVAIELNERVYRVEHIDVLSQNDKDKVLINSELNDLSSSVDVLPVADEPVVEAAPIVEAVPIVEAKPVVEAPLVVEEEESIDPLGGMKVDCLENTKKQALAENKLFFIKFGAKWCLPCKVMEQTTFKDETLKAYIADHYIPLNVDVDDFDGYNLKQLYQVNTLPSFLIFSADGTLLARFEESLSANALLNHLEVYNLEVNGEEQVEEEETLVMTQVELPAELSNSYEQLEKVLLQNRVK